MSLTLFSIVDFEPKLSEEALLIEEFKVLYSLPYNRQEGDSQGRERKRAIQECRFLYHFCHYKSEYTESNEEERFEESVSAAHLPETFVMSDELKACAGVVTKLQNTRMLKTLDVAELTLDKLRDYFKDIDFNEKDKGGALVHKPKEVMASIMDLGNTNKKLVDLRKLVKESMKETSSLKGDHEPGFDGAT